MTHLGRTLLLRANKCMVWSNHIFAHNLLFVAPQTDDFHSDLFYVPRTHRIFVRYPKVSLSFICKT